MKALSLLFLSILLLATSAHAGTDAAEAATLTLTPATLRTQLLNDSIGGSIGIEQALNQIHQAKAQLSLSRSQLLPSLQITPSIGLNNGNFIISSVQFLLPFLAPSNWFAYQAQKEVFNAQIKSYRIMQLNAYASVLSMYYTVAADHELENLYLQKRNDLNHLYEILAGSNKLLGTPSIDDVERTRAQVELSELQISQMREIENQGISALRFSLGLPLETELTLGAETENITFSPPVQPEETINTHAELHATVNSLLATTDEYTQLTALITAAKKQKWGATFASINTQTLSSSGNMANHTSASFTSMQLNSGINLGFGIFSAIELSSRNIDALNLRTQELKLELSRTLESTIGSLHEATQQTLHAENAIQALQHTYEVARYRYEKGSLPVSDLLQIRLQLTDAQIAATNARTKTNLLRTTLNRTLVRDEFVNITGCKPFAEEKPKSFFGKIKNYFEGAPSHLTIDQFCR